MDIPLQPAPWAASPEDLAEQTWEYCRIRHFPGCGQAFRVSHVRIAPGDEARIVTHRQSSELVCVLEEVSGYAGKAQPGSAMFRFGEHFGFLKGIIQALEVRLVLVRPQVWQRGFGLGTASACASKTIWKNKLKAEAQRRFPHLNVTLKTADALLILEHSISEGI